MGGRLLSPAMSLRLRRDHLVEAIRLHLIGLQDFRNFTYW